MYTVTAASEVISRPHCVAYCITQQRCDEDYLHTKCNCMWTSTVPLMYYLSMQFVYNVTMYLRIKVSTY